MPSPSIREDILGASLSWVIFHVFYAERAEFSATTPEQIGKESVVSGSGLETAQGSVQHTGVWAEDSVKTSFR